MLSRRPRNIIVFFKKINLAILMFAELVILLTIILIAVPFLAYAVFSGSEKQVGDLLDNIAKNNRNRYKEKK